MPHDSLSIPAHRMAVPEDAVQRFEDAWLRGESPEIDAYLTGEGQSRQALLIELVHTDLEYRLKAGEPCRIESYIRRFPELQADHTVFLGLAAAEYDLRRRGDANLRFDEYFDRFPERRDSLRELFESLQPPKPPDQISLCCPQCREPIELTHGVEPGEIACPSCGATMRIESDAVHTAFRFLDSKSLGKFEILETLGIGAFGAVYKARDTQLDRVVAIKIPRLGGLTTDEDRERFLREACHVAQLSHPGIISLYEVGRYEGVPYLVSDFVAGKTLSEAATLTPLTFRQVAECVSAVAEILQYAHEHGVVHRDIKPANIIIGQDGNPRIMDFGLAKSDAVETVISLNGHVVGTPAYLSPEQACGDQEHVDGRSDIYGLGVILYELLAGELPFRGIPRMILPQVLYDDPRPPRRLNDKIPVDLEAITLKCMEKETKRRYQSARELSEDLRRWLRNEPVLARPVRAWQRALRWTKRRPTVSALIATIAVLTVASLGVITWKWRDAIAAREEAINALALAEARQSEAEHQRDQAQRERARADRNFDWVRQSLTDLFAKINENPEMRQAPLQQAHDDLLTTALSFYEDIARDRSDDPRLEADRGRAYWQRAFARSSRNQPEAALADYRQMEAIFADLSANSRDEPEYQSLLGWSWTGQANMLRELRRYDDAKKAYDKAIAILEPMSIQHPSDPENQFRLGVTYLERGREAEASGDVTTAGQWYSRALEALAAVIPPAGGQLARDHRFRVNQVYELLMTDLVQSGRWDRAAETASQVAQLEPNLPTRWYDYAIARLAANRSDDYRNTCTLMLARFGDTRDPDVAARVLYACVPSPNALPEPSKLLRLAELATNERKGNFRLLGAARYRAGQFADAIDALDEAASEAPRRGWDWFFLAMAHHRAGHTDDAQRCLAEGIRWHDDITQRDPDGSRGQWGWTERVEVQQLRDEAEQLLAMPDGNL